MRGPGRVITASATRSPCPHMCPPPSSSSVLEIESVGHRYRQNEGQSGQMHKPLRAIFKPFQRRRLRVIGHFFEQCSCVWLGVYHVVVVVVRARLSACLLAVPLDLGSPRCPQLQTCLRITTHTHARTCTSPLILLAPPALSHTTPGQCSAKSPPNHANATLSASSAKALWRSQPQPRGSAGRRRAKNK